jgi:hypothetical protein
MGFFANIKAKRADKAATEEFNRLQLMWEEDVEQLKKLITVFTAASHSPKARELELEPRLRRGVLLVAPPLRLRRSRREPSQFNHQPRSLEPKFLATPYRAAGRSRTRNLTVPIQNFIAPSLPLRGDQAVTAHTTRAPAPPFPMGRGA